MEWWAVLLAIFSALMKSISLMPRPARMREV